MKIHHVTTYGDAGATVGFMNDMAQASLQSPVLEEVTVIADPQGKYETKPAKPVVVKISRDELTNKLISVSVWDSPHDVEASAVANPLIARLRAFATDCVISGDMTPAAKQVLLRILDES